MKTLFVLLCSAFLSSAGTVLVLTEPTARALAGKDFDRWLAKMYSEGWTPIVREGERWTGSVVSNDWRLLNWESNEVARIKPDAVQIFGRLARLKTGYHNLDGHGSRNILTDFWLGCTNLTFTDVEDYTPTPPYPAVNPLILTNKPGDGIPDLSIVSTNKFFCPVARLDASGMTSSAGNFASGYLAGQPYLPAIDEGYWLRCYLSNNIAHRSGEWTTPTNGFIDTSSWLVGSSAITSVNQSVAWTTGGWTVAPGQYRWYYSATEPHLHSPYSVSSEGVWTRPVVTVVYKSYQMEDTDGIRYLNRWLFPGFAPHPISLTGMWTVGYFGATPFWAGQVGNVTVADVFRSSVQRNGYLTFSAWLVGDITLPLAPGNRQGKVTVTTWNGQ